MSIHTRRTTRAAAGLAVGLLLGAGLASCSGDNDAERAQGSPSAGGESGSATTPEAPVELTTNLKSGTAVPVDKEVRLEADGGTLRTVKVSSGAGTPLAGGITDDKKAWVAQALLEPGTTYTAKAVTQSPSGTTRRTSTTFRTVDLTLDQQTFAAIAPLDGETVGVGMPVVVNFDVGVTDKKAIQKHMSVTSSPQQPGSWHWLSDNEVHWRPKTYWRAGTDVSVDIDVNSVPAGNGIYGQESRRISFHVGDSVISRVSATTHQMKTFINGKLAKTTPITTGKAGHTTRSGVKVIMEKFRQKRMNSETVGIDPASADGYDIDDVEYAMRVTYSGEFLHAAPWSVGDQGRANVSHGCTGMSTADAKWIYDHSRRGDVVEYTGTDRPMTLTNGYGDWNASYASWRAGSAL